MSSANHRWLIALAPALMIAVAMATFPAVSSHHAGDLTLYRTTAAHILDGALPYRDFPFEYPPVAVVPMVLAGLFVSPTADLSRYNLFFLIENAAFCAVLAWCVSHVAKRLAPGRSVSTILLLFAVLAAIGAPVFAWRFDLFPAMLTMLGVLALLSQRPALAGAMIGLGAGAKLYPLVLVPIVVAYYLSANEGAALRRFAIATTLAFALPLLPFGLELSGMVAYHMKRGLQLESVASGLLLLGGPPVSIVHDYGAMHIRTPSAAAVLRVLPFVMIAAISLVTARAWKTLRAAGTAKPHDLLRYALAAILVFIVANKVYSPQYVAWILPFIPLLRLREAALGSLIVVLTIWVFPFHYRALMSMETAAVVLLNLRNAATVALLLSLVFATTASARSKKGQIRSRAAWSEP